MAGTSPVTGAIDQASVSGALGAASGAVGQAGSRPAGLPPAYLAGPASVNTVNAGLVSSQWGVDPALVSGAYGANGAQASQLGAEMLLPLLAALTHSDAEQALSLLGIQVPVPAGSAPAAPDPLLYEHADAPLPPTQ